MDFEFPEWMTLDDTGSAMVDVAGLRAKLHGEEVTELEVRHPSVREQIKFQSVANEEDRIAMVAAVLCGMSPDDFGGLTARVIDRITVAYLFYSRPSGQDFGEASDKLVVKFEDYPLVVSETQVNALEMREPTGADKLAVKNEKSSAYKEAAIIARLTNQDRDTILNMPLNQYGRLMEAYSAFTM